MAKLRLIGMVTLVAAAAVAASGCKKETAKAATAPPAVTVAQPIAREVLDYDEYQGKMEAVAEVEVRARVRGYLDSIGFRDGEEVKKGQLLFQIDPKPFEATVQAAEGQLAQVRARRITADADVKRYKDLVPKGAATAQDLDRAIGQLAEAEAGIQTAAAQVEQAKLDLAYSRLIAPMDGLISKTNLSVGNLVGAGGSDQLLTTIISIDPIRVTVDVDQRALQRYQAQRQASGAGPTTQRESIPFQFGRANDEGFPYQGVFTFIDNKIDPNTGTIKVRGEVKNDQRLFKPGYYARVRVAVGEKYPAVLVSERAIGTQQGEKYVWVVDGANKVEFRKVQLGAAQEGGLRVVTKGLKANERIIVNGLQRARNGIVVAPEAGEMIARPAGAATQPVASGH